MYHLVFLMAVLLTANTATAQQYTFVKKWDKRYGGTSTEYCSLLLPTEDGGYLVAGGSQSPVSGEKTQPNWDTTLQFNDYWIIKVDANGNKQWDKRFGGFLQDNLFVARQTLDAGYILGGFTISGIDGDKTQPAWGGWDYWIVKIDSVGNKQWDKRYGGTANDELWDLQQTKDGGYILGGYSNSSIGGDKTQPNWDPTQFYGDFWIVKVDATGSKEWDKRFGGVADETLHSIMLTDDMGYLLGGYSTSDSSGDKTQNSRGYTDYWVVKIDSTGNKQWDKRFGGADEDMLKSMSITNEGGYVLSGISDSNISGDKTVDGCNANFDYWIVKVSAVGNKEWDYTYGGQGDDGLMHIEPLGDGGYLLSGSSKTTTPSCEKSESNMGARQSWLVKIDTLGNKQWDKTVLTQGTEDGCHALQSNDGCYVVGSYTSGGIGGYKSQPSWDAGGDYWIMKFCMDTVTGFIPALAKGEGGIQVQVYPNPFSTDVAISVQKENLHEASFTISNSLGQIIYQREENNLRQGYTKMLDLRYLPNGLYFITVEADGERVVRRVVKE